MNVVGKERILFAVVGGALVTYFLPLSSAIVGLFASLLFPRYALPVFLGSFVGMTSSLVAPPLQILVGATFAAVIFLLLGARIPNVGGKAGFIAFLGILITLALFGEIPHPKTLVLEIEEAALLFLSSVLAIYLVFWLKRRAPGNPVVFSASLVGILAGLVYHLQPFLGEVMYAAAFAGMAPDHLLVARSESVVIGMVTALMYLLLSQFLPGVGGKLGTIAFVSWVVYLLYKGRFYSSSQNQEEKASHK